MSVGHGAAALLHLGDLAHRLNRNQVPLPSQLRTAEAAASLGAADAEIPDIPAVTLDALADKLRAGAQEGHWDALTSRDWRQAPWALWTGAPVPASLTSVIDALRVRALSARGSARARALAGSYLQSYRADHPGLSACAEAVRDALSFHAPTDNRARQWVERDRTVALFDAVNGPTQVGRAMIDSMTSPNVVMHALGLDQPQLAVGGYTHAVHDMVLERLESELPLQSGGSLLARLRPLIELPSGELRFPAGAALLAERLLRPWCDGKAAPSDTLRQTITDLLLKHLGDPRAARSTRWQMVSSVCVNLFRQWIARATLEEFFDVISDQTDVAQWRHRRAFWLSVIHAGAVEDAWVVLAPGGERTARRRLGQAIGYGKLRGYAADQSVVLLRIRNLICAEVSHNGSLRIWRNDWKNAPKLGQIEYGREDLSGAGLDFPGTTIKGRLAHIGGDRGLWQSQAADLLRRQTGIRLDQNRWSL